MHEFIAALRHLRFPIVALAVAVLVLQSLVAGLASAHAADRTLSGGVQADIFCHGNVADGGGSGGHAHEESGAGGVGGRAEQQAVGAGQVLRDLRGLPRRAL